MAPDNLLNQLLKNKIKFVASARDVFTEISKEATTNMSGMRGLPLIYPVMIKNNQLVHIPSNFHATSKIERALQIIENSGLLSVKAHIVKNALGIISYDGIDEVYMNYLDMILTFLETKYGNDLWWTSMGEISNYIIERSLKWKE